MFKCFDEKHLMRGEGECKIGNYSMRRKSEADKQKYDCWEKEVVTRLCWIGEIYWLENILLKFKERGRGFNQTGFLFLYLRMVISMRGARSSPEVIPLK